MRRSGLASKLRCSWRTPDRDRTAVAFLDSMCFNKRCEATQSGKVLPKGKVPSHSRVNGVPPLYREWVALCTGARFPSLYTLE